MELRSRWGVPQDATVVGCVARLVPRKGQDALLAVWPEVRRRHPHARLVLIGEGPLRRRLERAAGRLEGAHVVGPVAWEELPSAYAALDVFAMPVRTRLAGLDVEGLGISLLEAQAAGLPRAYSILDSGDVRSILREIHRELQLPDEANDVRQSASIISRVKNGAPVRPDTTTGKVMAAYQARLARLGALDFDDLLLRTPDLLEQDATIRAKYQRRFRYVLVDEYQDTNPVQYRIVGLLSAGHRNICVVGDADQAIYGFRSATPAALQTFSDDWPDAGVVILEENYRSSAAILSAGSLPVGGIRRPSDS